jgi:hypothetical protein
LFDQKRSRGGGIHSTTHSDDDACLLRLGHRRSI